MKKRFLLTRILGALVSAALVGAPPAAHDTTEPSFRNHVQSVLTKSGCNMGSCHGAAAGKNGLYLSLRGYNDEADWMALTRNAGGRRLNLADPGQSLVLLKATGTLPHKGGKRFEVGSPEYQTLAQWIASGAPGPKEKDPRLVRLQVLPAHATLSIGQTQSMEVHATFSDGRIENVTRWAKYTSANEPVANVADIGEVKIVGPGEAGITAWYLSQIAVGFVTSPFTNVLSGDPATEWRTRNFIDEKVNAKLRELQLPPSPRCSDSEFLRRASLDTLGVLPTLSEVREFLANNDPKKRDALIDRLLQRPEFVDYWTYRWSDLLLVNSKSLRTGPARAYYDWIRQQVARNRPWDEIARELVTANGSTLELGAGNFFLLHEDPRALAETTTQAFMGMSIGCARCHNHPSEKWTNDDYFAFANLFSRVRAKNTETDGERILVSTPDGELIQPRTGRPQKPRPLDGTSLELDSPIDRRAHLAEWLTSRENTYFARAIVNRLWANFLGVGLVDRVDDLRVSNPPTNEPLLAAAADFLVAQRYDLKSLMREILRSETYQRSSEPLPGNISDQRYYSRYYPRRLMAEVILDAYSQVTGVPTDFKRLTGNGDSTTLDYPLGTRALELPDSQIASYFLKNFGKPDRVQTCDCERTTEPSVAQVLHIANGSTLNEKLKSDRCRIAGIQVDVASGNSGAIAGWVDEAYLTSLTRPPTANERRRLMAAIQEAPAAERRAVLEDISWALLSSKEFLFNH